MASPTTNTSLPAEYSDPEMKALSDDSQKMYTLETKDNSSQVHIDNPPSTGHLASPPVEAPKTAPSSCDDDTTDTPYSRSSTDRIEADESCNEEDAETSYSTFLSSIASKILRGVSDGGRLYAAYGQHKPWVPIDEPELDRNDLQHTKFKLLLNDQLFLAPIISDPKKILDLGTGSGIWAIEMAEKYESAEVIGIDTAAVQPSNVPLNCLFEIDDIENEWLFQKETFDFIHARELVLAIRDWPRLMDRAFNTLKPGGYIQLAGSVPDFTSDDGSFPEDTAYGEVGSIYFEMGERIGASGRDPLKWRDNLIAAGFTNVVEKLLKIPTNPWPKDPRMKEIGAFELCNFREGISNIFARGYTQILGGDPNYFQVLMANARREVMDRSMHSYVPFYVVWGQKPESSVA